MYESPINVFERNICNKLTEEKENLVIAAEQEVGVTVDKEELEKALRYDRQQYEKGYADAKSEQRWIPCNERMPEIAKDVLTTYIDGETKRRHVREDAWLPNDDSEKNGWCNEEDDYRCNGLNMEVIAWMPFPEPYKG